MATYVASSPIHGQGTFAGRAFAIGDHIMPVLQPAAGSRVTLEGKYVNHCWDAAANGVLQTCGPDLCLVAARPIARDAEICANYNSAPSGIKRADSHWT
jgi:hypothetical protein